MYCRNCGAELSEGSKFCHKCGASTEEGNIHANRHQDLKKTALLISMILLIVVALVVIFLFVKKMIHEKQDANSFPKAATEMDNGDAFISDNEVLNVSDAADQYIENAKMYVEKGDLYSAKSILEKGYEDTQDESLQNVSIYGPLSCYDNVLITEEFPVVATCEYVFSNNTVIGKINFLETSAARIEYFFSSEEERIIGEVITAYNMSVAGVNSKADEILQQDVYYCFDCLYNEKGEVVSLVDEYDQEEFVTMEYENGRCVSVDYMDTYHFQYDDKGRITSVTIPDSDSNLQMLFAYGPDGSYTVRGPAGMNSDFFGKMGDSWELTVNQSGFLQELIVGEEKIIEVEFGDRGEIICSNGLMDDYYGRDKQIEYEYKEDGDISRVLIYGTDSESSQEYILEAEVIYLYNSKKQMTDIVCNSFDGIDTKSYYEKLSYHIDYDQNGRGVRIEETGNGDQNAIYEISYSDDGKVERIKGLVNNTIVVFKYEYDRYGRWLGMVNISESDEQAEKLDEPDNVVDSETSPYLITDAAESRLYLIADEHPWEQFLYAYLVLEEVESGETNVVSIPCETVLYAMDDTVKRVCDFQDLNEIIISLNENYDLNLSDFVSISIKDLLSEMSRQSGNRLDLGTTFTSGEIEEISSLIQSDANKDLMLEAWNKALDKQELSPADLLYIGDIFAQKQISPKLRKKFGETLFLLFDELPATRTIFETVYTGYEEEEFKQDCLVNYNGAHIATVFTDRESMESLGVCYYPEDAAAFSAQVQYHWSGNTNYTPSEKVSYIAARMKEIYAEEVEN